MYAHYIFCLSITRSLISPSRPAPGGKPEWRQVRAVPQEDVIRNSPFPETEGEYCPRGRTRIPDGSNAPAQSYRLDSL